MKWILWTIIGLVALIGLRLAQVLIVRLWHQFVRNETSIEIEVDPQGHQDYITVANDIVRRERPIDSDTWMSKDEYRTLRLEVKKRWARNSQTSGKS